MKYLLVIVVVGVLLWLMFGSGRRARLKERDAQPRQAGDKPQPILACAHCGVHLPAADAHFDAERRPYCTEAHRLAGPQRGG